MSESKPVMVVGSINVDLVLSASRFAAPGETLSGKEFQIFAGGKGANQAASAARLGFPTHLFARVGDDLFAPMMIKELTTIGVDVANVKATPGSTGIALITTVTGGQNSIIIVPGANQTLTPQDVDLEWVFLRHAAVVLAQLEIPIETVSRLAARCAADHIPFILDPAPVQTLPSQLMRNVTWFTPNENEVLGFTGRDISGAEEPELLAAAHSFIEKGVSGVVLKLGARGAYIVRGSDEPRWIRPFKVDPVDTTAAGDTFNGAFAAALLRLVDPYAAGRFACAAAALSTMRRGAVPSMPTYAEVEQLMKSTEN